MTHKMMIRRTLIVCLFFIALGGWLLHLRIHPVAKQWYNIIPMISGIISVFLIPLLFSFDSKVTTAYVINGFLAIIGTITMAHFSVVNFKGPMTAANIILNTTIADIAILWGKFLVGKVIFDLQRLKTDADPAAKGHFFRYPNMGWWWAHLFALSAVYVIGNIFWK